MRRRLPLAAGIVVLAAVVAAVTVPLVEEEAGGGSPAQATAEVFARYVQPDGRVVRWDQGGDTVSEGQAYAMLLAVASGDRSRFASVWGWTRANLQRPDGLLAWHWAGGRVVDQEPASDADLDAAWALALASRRWRSPAYAGAARRMASAILAEETVAYGGTLVLVAGPWATGQPPTVDPSYFSPLAYVALGRLTGDPRWAQLSASSLAVLGQLTSDPTRLPPDWASLGQGGAVPVAGPTGASSPSYGLDAARVEVWYAASCSPDERAVAARSWALLGGEARAGHFPITSTLGGSPSSGDVNALVPVADAAAAAAAGDGGQVASLLSAAGRMDRSHPTYYGTAWLALGRVLLQTHELGGCATTAGSPSPS